jgi:hypothetical protein
MVCAKCGCEQDSNARFCRQCGAPQHAAPPLQPAWAGGLNAPYAPGMAFAPSLRVRQNLQPLGIMWCIFGAYRLVTMLIAVSFLHTMVSGGMFGGMPNFVSHAMRAMVPMILLMTVVMASAAILTGYALLTRQPWGRVLAIVVGILALVKIPFGTALGIYTLWVLAPQASGAEWDEMTRPAV